MKEFISLKEESRTLLEYYFSNSLIIHRAETKKIITVMEVWIPVLISIDLRFYFSVLSLVFVSIQKIYQTLETMFHWLSKHLEFRQKYAAACGIFKFSTFNCCCLRTSQDNFAFL